MNHTLREQVVQFEDNADKILIGNIITSLMLLFLISPVTDKQTAILWLALQMVFNVARIFVTHQYKRVVLQDDARILSRYRLHMLLTLASSLIWGSSALFLFPEHNSEYQLLYLLVIVGYLASALSLSNLITAAYPMLMLTISAFVYGRLVTQDEPYTLRLIIILTMFIILMLVVARTFRKQYVEGIELKLELHQQAYQDVLTGLFNRRYFMEQLKEEWFRSIRNQQPISVILLDIDHFKKVNDRYGHQKGDDCLIDIARAMTQSVN